MFGLDTQYDVWRMINVILGVLCFYWLMGGLYRQKEQWNVKTRDFWYSRLMWAVVGIAISIEGIYFHRTLTYSLPMVTIASLVTFKGLAKKGSWGYNADA